MVDALNSSLSTGAQLKQHRKLLSTKLSTMFARFNLLMLLLLGTSLGGQMAHLALRVPWMPFGLVSVPGTMETREQRQRGILNRRSSPPCSWAGPSQPRTRSQRRKSGAESREPETGTREWEAFPVQPSSSCTRTRHAGRGGTGSQKRRDSHPSFWTPPPLTPTPYTVPAVAERRRLLRSRPGRAGMGSPPLSCASLPFSHTDATRVQGRNGSSEAVEQPPMLRGMAPLTPRPRSFPSAGGAPPFPPG